jgi:hypothetical protein
LKPSPRHSLLIAFLLAVLLASAAAGQIAPGDSVGARVPPPAQPDGSPAVPPAPMLPPRLPGALSGPEQSIKITTEIDKVVIRVGDLIHYNMTIEAPAGAQVMMPPPGVQLGEFIIRDYDFPELDGKKERKVNWRERLAALRDRPPAGMVRQHFNFTVTAYDTGDLVIPPLPFGVKEKSGQVHAFYSESARVRVVPFTNPDDLTVRDIKAPVEIPVALRRYLPYLALVIAALAAIPVAVVLLRRRRRAEEELAAPRPPHELAVEDLLALEREDLLATGQYERFYTRLSFILRRYLGGRFLFYALEQTSSEILDTLKNMDLSHADHERVRRLLLESDLVKFARREPDLDDRNSAISRVRDLVETTRERPAEPGPAAEAA